MMMSVHVKLIVLQLPFILVLGSNLLAQSSCAKFWSNSCLTCVVSRLMMCRMVVSL